MASTRNRNTKSNYCIEQKSYRLGNQYLLNTDKRFSKSNAMPDFGVFVSHMPNTIMSRNAVDIESSLRGIGSTNLVDPKPPTQAQLTKLPEVKYYDKIPIIMHEDHSSILLKNQRPFPISS
tara:strand:+ start:563 stop:925 length:363 start_codon:yes stop_codon:yes gene_type:complete